MKTVKLDIFEMGYLLDACLRGSHLRSDTIRRFVDEWYKLLTPQERMSLFEWTIRLTYDQRWGSEEKNYKPHFEKDSRCCGADEVFVHRYHPGNQYIVTAEYDEKVERYQTFLMRGRHYIDSRSFIAPEYITSVEKIPNPEWEQYKQPHVDYDRNIIECES